MDFGRCFPVGGRYGATRLERAGGVPLEKPAPINLTSLNELEGLLNNGLSKNPNWKCLLIALLRAYSEARFNNSLVEELIPLMRLQEDSSGIQTNHTIKQSLLWGRVIKELMDKKGVVCTGSGDRPNSKRQRTGAEALGISQDQVMSGLLFQENVTLDDCKCDDMLIADVNVDELSKLKSNPALYTCDTSVLLNHSVYIKKVSKLTVTISDPNDKRDETYDMPIEALNKMTYKIWRKQQPYTVGIKIEPGLDTSTATQQQTEALQQQVEALQQQVEALQKKIERHSKKRALGPDCITMEHNGLLNSIIYERMSLKDLVALLSGTDDQKYMAAGALLNLAVNTDNQVAIAQAGGITPLVALLSGTDIQKYNAAVALTYLARNTAHQAAIAEAGGITPLVALLSGTDIQKYNAAVALTYLARNTAHQAAIAEAGGIGPLEMFLKSTVSNGDKKIKRRIVDLVRDLKK